MSIIRRLMKVFTSLVMIAIGIIIFTTPKDVSYTIVAIIIGVVIAYKGIKNFIFYLVSARHMVGGEKIFINSVILINLAAVSFFVLMESQLLAMLYLVTIFIVLGAIDILRAFEIKKVSSKRWIFKFAKGLIAIALGVICIVFIKSTELMLLMFAIGWIVMGVAGVISSFEKGSVTYIPEI